MLDREILQYSIGALMYTPASDQTIADDLQNKKFLGLKSLALCLEDSIGDDSLRLAETKLLDSLLKIHQSIEQGKIISEEIPLLFVRVRSAEQLDIIYEQMGNSADILCGFILPKFNLSNAENYRSIIKKINQQKVQPLYFMPIIESPSIMNLESRIDTLLKIKAIVDDVKSYILNIRVGGNDFCNLFGLRRSYHQTIYDITIIKNALVDILNIFARDYVVSGVVWEYFANKNSENWQIGLKKELELDLLNGFIGKTAIHPSQVPIILESLKVNLHDFEDAKKITNWDDVFLGVAKSVSGERMNESKVHINWAKKILILAQIYGVRSNG